MKLFKLHLFFLFITILSCNQKSDTTSEKAAKQPSMETTKTTPVPVIFDTDIGPDYDDAGAMAVLHALADSGEATILATVSSNKNELVAPTIDVLNTYFGRPNIPIGAPKKEGGVNMGASQKWPEAITAKYPHKLKSTADAPDAVTVYRKILAQQPDSSVTIVTVGFLTNLSNLLDSQSDSISPLTGKELVGKKVKQLVSMAGGFPQGREFNLFMDSIASVKVLREWKTPIIFSGAEIGEKILTGKRLISSDSIQQSPVKDAFSISLPKSEEDRNGRKSWDQTAVLVAVRGTRDYYDLKEGRIIVKEDGSNAWDSSGTGHFYLVEKMPVTQITEVIEDLMMHQPKKAK